MRREDITDLKTFKSELAAWIIKQLEVGNVSKDGTIEVSSYHHGSLCAYNSILGYWLDRPSFKDFKFVDPKTKTVKGETHMTPSEKRALRLSHIRKHGFVDLMCAVKDILGERATYLKNVDDLTDGDVDLVWEAMTAYSRERRKILDCLTKRLGEITSKVHREEILRLIRAIDNNT